MSYSPGKSDSVFHSFQYAFRGVGTAWANERNFRVQCFYGLFVLCLLAGLGVTGLRAALAIFSVVLLLAAELGNSALERVVDLVSSEWHLLAGQAKDLAAAGVMLISFGSAGIVLCILIEACTN